MLCTVRDGTRGVPRVVVVLTRAGDVRLIIVPFVGAVAGESRCRLLLRSKVYSGAVVGLARNRGVRCLRVALHEDCKPLPDERSRVCL